MSLIFFLSPGKINYKLTSFPNCKLTFNICMYLKWMCLLNATNCKFEQFCFQIFNIFFSIPSLFFGLNITVKYT